MAALKLTFTALLRTPAFVPCLSKVRNLNMPCKTTEKNTESWSSTKLNIKQKQFSENIKLITTCDNVPNLLDKGNGKPLVVILQWLMAKNKHVWKFIDIYLNYGFDVLPVKLKTGQLIWPTTGSQIVAKDLLNVLSENYAERPIVIHGFSVGGYLWGEVQLKMAENLEKYQPLINNITGAIWDSVVDIDETAVGVPAAVFPNNALLRNACRKYILYHMKTFEKESTRHWRNSRDMFYRPIVKCPSLLLYSKTDPIGNTNSYKKVRISYESLGIQIYEKCWDRSPHVAHYAFHKEEYINQMEMFLEKIGLMDSVANKRAAAL
ncbi:UNVERIFIED_CONTAM: hypothetical protein PYX00_001006 [Menopon gallinae]|uniref:Uncharacterized protein n=1 Tax=Menopon gallinae TaxID=328185 RepID=A0AAW2ICF9_9NEOP